MADYAGAVAAIEDRFRTAWANRTPIAISNDTRPDAVDEAGEPRPWLFLEVVGAGSRIVGAGRPGDHQWVQDGLIQIHVFVPRDTGSNVALGLAVAAGEVFRAAEFYRSDGACVRSWAPRIDGGGSGSDDGLWWTVSAVVPFEFLFRG